ncbi:MAG: peptide-methionine (S)-S-oxide reductase MsrA [Pyrinomonadaceae bacterium]
MQRSTTVIKLFLIAIAAVAAGCSVASSSSMSGVDIRKLAPAPAQETATSPANGVRTAVFAGGCFWGVEAVFEHVKGVTDVKSGYSGGDAKSANYDDVSDGRTLHAEAVIVTYDPAKVTYAQLLTVFFSVAHDPTEVDRQGPDVGPQYRSAIFYANEEQKKLANDYIAAINKAKVFSKPIATQLVPLEKFYDAEDYHQDYMKKNPNQPYIVHHDRPKVAALKEKFPELYVEKK